MKKLNLRLLLLKNISINYLRHQTIAFLFINKLIFRLFNLIHSLIPN